MNSRQKVVRVDLATKAEIDKIAKANGWAIPKVLKLAIEVLKTSDPAGRLEASK